MAASPKLECFGSLVLSNGRLYEAVHPQHNQHGVADDRSDSLITTPTLAMFFCSIHPVACAMALGGGLMGSTMPDEEPAATPVSRVLTPPAGARRLPMFGTDNAQDGDQQCSCRRMRNEVGQRVANQTGTSVSVLSRVHYARKAPFKNEIDNI